VKKATSNGSLRWKGKTYFVGEAFAGTRLGGARKDDMGRTVRARDARLSAPCHLFYSLVVHAAAPADGALTIAVWLDAGDAASGSVPRVEPLERWLPNN
jgi:hypothetical protein